MKDDMCLISLSKSTTTELLKILSDYIYFNNGSQGMTIELGTNKRAISIYNTIKTQMTEYERRKDLYYGMAGE